MKNHKKLIIAICAALSIPFAIHAEKYRLKYAASVDVLDDNGSVVGKHQLKSGTVIQLAAPPSAKKSNPTYASRPSGIAPAQFLRERRTAPTTFVAVGTLDNDPIIIDEKRLNKRTHICVSLGIYGKNRQEHESVDAYAPVFSIPSVNASEILSDCEQHKLLVTIRSFPKTKEPSEVELLDIRELKDDDPLIKALLATPL